MEYLLGGALIIFGCLYVGDNSKVFDVGQWFKTGKGYKDGK